MSKEIEVFFIQNVQGDLKYPCSMPIVTDNLLCPFDGKRRENRGFRFFQLLHQNSFFSRPRNDRRSFPCCRSSRIQDSTTFSHLIEVATYSNDSVFHFLNLGVCSFPSLHNIFTSLNPIEFRLSRHFWKRVFDGG